MAADVCNPALIPSRIKNIKVDSMSIGTPTFNGGSLGWATKLINGPLAGAAKSQINGALNTLLGGKTFGLC